MLGVRLTFHHEHDESWIRDGTADWFWPVAEKMNIPVMMNAPSIHKDVAGVAERHPSLRLILDHMGRLKGMKDDKLGLGLAPTIGLAKYPNVFVKLTSTPSCSTEDYPYRNIHPASEAADRGIRPAPVFLGNGLVGDAQPYEVHLSTGRYDVYRGDGFPLRRGSGVCDGPRTGGVPAVAGSLAIGEQRCRLTGR